MKRSTVVLLAGLFMALQPMGHASAHVLKTDGSIGAVLHIKPDDNPQSGKPTEYSVNFSDKNQRFSVADCDCRMAITSNNRLVATYQLKVFSEVVGGNEITFPGSGVYELTVSGKPKSGSDFQPFSMSFAVRVGGGDETMVRRNIPVLLWAGLALIIGLVLLSASRLNSYNENHKQ